MKFGVICLQLRWGEMGKKYFCDYCGKSFADSTENRKKHNSGIIHKKLREAHYEQFAGLLAVWLNSLVCQFKSIFLSDAKTRLEKELLKGPCRRFLAGQDCMFGDNCRFSHLLPHQLDQLRKAGRVLCPILAFFFFLIFKIYVIYS